MRLLVGSAVIVLCLSACDWKTRRQLRYVDVVDKQFDVALPGERVVPRLDDDHFLTITLIDSKLRELPVEAKRQKTLEIARAAFHAYPAREDLERVSVVYAIRRSKPGARYSDDDVSDTYRFTVAEVGN